MRKNWSIVFASAVIVVILAASLALAVPRKPKWTKCPTKGCADPCDPTVEGPYMCRDKKTGEFTAFSTFECCCCVEDAQHRWYRGMR